MGEEKESLSNAIFTGAGADSDSSASGYILAEAAVSLFDGTRADLQLLMYSGGRLDEEEALIGGGVGVGINYAGACVLRLKTIDNWLHQEKILCSLDITSRFDSPELIFIARQTNSALPYAKHVALCKPMQGLPVH